MIFKEKPNLKERIEKFTEIEHAFNKEFYEKLETRHNPHTLFIGCSDSRVEPETLFQAEAGEIFQMRNIANIVPREEEPDTHPSAVSAIEYAVQMLKVQNIIVCGHSKCGGCAALRKLKDYKKKYPYTGEWLSQSVSISNYIDEEYPDMKESDKIVMLEKLNAVQQLDNLMTYDFVRQKVKAKKINLQAYYYDIARGTISVYDYDSVLSNIIKEITSTRKDFIDNNEE